jgi:hypothetical protein
MHVVHSRICDSNHECGLLVRRGYLRRSCFFILVFLLVREDILHVTRPQPSVIRKFPSQAGSSPRSTEHT